MKKVLVVVAAIAILAAAGAAAVMYGMGEEVQFEGTGPLVGQPAPDFTLTAAGGNAVSLSDYRGQTVVLEWHNPGCPFVKKHYGSGNMQRTQATATGHGAVWLTINSGARFKQGHMDGDEAAAFVTEAGAQPTAYLLDPDGLVGRAYHAKTTPHMFIVDGAGTLVYAGGIDDNPTTNPSGIEGARNHVLAALTELGNGAAVSVPTSRPYGCNVKY